MITDEHLLQKSVLSPWFLVQPVAAALSWVPQKWSVDWWAPFHPVYKSLYDVRALSYPSYPSPYLSLSPSLPPWPLVLCHDDISRHLRNARQPLSLLTSKLALIVWCFSLLIFMLEEGGVKGNVITVVLGSVMMTTDKVGEDVRFHVIISTDC